MFTLLYGCCQVETCVPDLAVARQCMSELLQAAPIEQELARQIAVLMPGSGYDVDHLDCGGAVFQVNQPGRGMQFKGQPSVHQAYLDAQGPCVTNLNYYVDDVEHARQVLTGLGARVHLEGPSNVARALGDYGPGNTRPGGGDRPFLFMGTRPLIGFDLEIMEPNFLRFTEQTAQWPLGFGPRPVPATPFRLRRLVVIVPDLERASEAITTAIAPASRSKPYAWSETPDSRQFRIGFGGIEIEYRQPVRADGTAAAHLERFGPGVSAVVFGHADLDGLSRSNPLWRRSGPGAVAAVRSTVGFDIEVEPPESYMPAVG